MSARVEVLIVGGRPAGAALATRLAARGLRVLLLDRGRFPSLPGVPSSPILYPAAMAELDALGVPPDAYEHPHARMRSFTMQFAPWWHTVIPMPTLRGRDYVLGVDRARLDAATWAGAACERREGWAVRDLLRGSDDRVEGVVAVGPEGQEERIAADCVIGADGRFSLVARRAGAEVVEERDAHTSTVYYADWEGVGPDLAGGAGAHVVATGRGLDVLFFAMPDGRFSVNTHARSDRVDVRGDPQGYYLSTLRGLPAVWSRLQGARQVSRLVGIKRVGNGYRRAFGPGWALVGDALHYKDPVDGQGVYDALLGARLLADALLQWQGGLAWEVAMEGYASQVRAATHPMYLATTDRLRRELYEEPPVPVIRTLIRWWMTDPEYQSRFLRYLDRELPPDRWLTPGLMAGATLRGMARDVSSLFGPPRIAGPG